MDGTNPVELSIGSTVPVEPMALAMAIPASLPPARLSDWMLEIPMVVSVRSPSIVMILMPLALAAFSGAAIAFGSVTEIMIAPGLVSVTCWTIAVCFWTSNVGAPW